MWIITCLVAVEFRWPCKTKLFVFLGFYLLYFNLGMTFINSAYLSQALSSVSNSSSLSYLFNFWVGIYLATINSFASGIPNLFLITGKPSTLLWKYFLLLYIRNYFSVFLEKCHSVESCFFSCYYYFVVAELLSVAFCRFEFGFECSKSLKYFCNLVIKLEINGLPHGFWVRL